MTGTSSRWRTEAVSQRVARLAGRGTLEHILGRPATGIRFSFVVGIRASGRGWRRPVSHRAVRRGTARHAKPSGTCTLCPGPGVCTRVRHDTVPLPAYHASGHVTEPGRTPEVFESSEVSIDGLPAKRHLLSRVGSAGFLRTVGGVCVYWLQAQCNPLTPGAATRSGKAPGWRGAEQATQRCPRHRAPRERAGQEIFPRRVPGRLRRSSSWRQAGCMVQLAATRSAKGACSWPISCLCTAATPKPMGS
jgi:hypothetical protein